MKIRMTETLLHYEDINVGLIRECGDFTIEEDEAREFAEQYDPQLIPIDGAAAADSVFEGLSTSGWQTVVLTVRTMVTGYLNDTASMGADGIDDLRWHRPVRAGRNPLSDG